MKILRQSKRVQLRAEGALLVLLVGWLSAPLALAAYEADVCTMECCIAVGHCCCSPRHEYVKGEIPSGRDELRSPGMNSPCPRGCSTPGVSASNFTGTVAREHSHFEATAPPPIRRAEVSRAHAVDYFEIAAPRAPPISTLRQS